MLFLVVIFCIVLGLILSAILFKIIDWLTWPIDRKIQQLFGEYNV